MPPAVVSTVSDEISCEPLDASADSLYLGSPQTASLEIASMRDNSAASIL
jgi:hypothetical protein